MKFRWRAGGQVGREGRRGRASRAREPLPGDHVLRRGPPNAEEEGEAGRSKCSGGPIYGIAQGKAGQGGQEEAKNGARGSHGDRCLRQIVGRGQVGEGAREGDLGVAPRWPRSQAPQCATARVLLRERVGLGRTAAVLGVRRRPRVARGLLARRDEVRPGRKAAQPVPPPDRPELRTAGRARRTGRRGGRAEGGRVRAALPRSLPWPPWRPWPRSLRRRLENPFPRRPRTRPLCVPGQAPGLSALRPAKARAHKVGGLLGIGGRQVPRPGA